MNCRICASLSTAAVRESGVRLPQTFKLANGLTVIYDERPGLPVVAANLVVRGGYAADPPGKRGVSSFAVAMLEKGTTTRSANDIAAEAARLGASLALRTSTDQSSISIRS